MILHRLIVMLQVLSSKRFFGLETETK